MHCQSSDWRAQGAFSNLCIFTLWILCSHYAFINASWVVCSIKIDNMHWAMAVADDIVAIALNCNLLCFRSLHHCWLAEKEVAYHRALQTVVHCWQSIISLCNIKKKNSRPARYALLEKIKCTIEEIYLMVHWWTCSVGTLKNFYNSTYLDSTHHSIQVERIQLHVEKYKSAQLHTLSMQFTSLCTAQILLTSQCTVSPISMQLANF